MTAPAEDSLRASYINSLPPAGSPAAGPVDPALLRQLAEGLGPQYVVGERIARGGFCEILECCDMELDRRLAIKVLRPDVGGTQDMRARFKQEARAIARLTHPNIIPIHFVGDADGLAYYAMPFIQGRTLADLLGDQKAMPARRLVPLVIPVLEALHHAHQAGIVHRDIKPDNILVEDESNRPLLLDFGIAKCLTGAAHQTQAGFIVGTPLYMSPEQALGRDQVDARSDIYAFGVMMFQLATGSAPFEGETSQEIVGRHLGDPVPLPTVRNPAVPGWLSAIIVRCLAKRPSDRFACALEVADALRAGLVTGVLDLRPRTPMPDERASIRDLPPPAVPARVRRHWRALAVAAGGMGLAAMLALVVAARPAGTATISISNALLNPVALKLVDGTERVLAPGDSMSVTWSSDETFDAEWHLVRPVSLAGEPMGEELSGTLHERKPRGDVRQRIDVTALDGEYFSPRVTNASGVPLRLSVERQSGAHLCDCEVPTGAEAAAMGYYRLAPRTMVRLRDLEDREVAYDLDTPIRERVTGAMAVRVKASHVPEVAVASAGAPAATPRRAAPRVTTRRSVLGAVSRPSIVPQAEPQSPVVEEPPPVPDPLPEPVAEPVRPPVARRGSSNPAAGFLPGLR